MNDAVARLEARLTRLFDKFEADMKKEREKAYETGKCLDCETETWEVVVQSRVIGIAYPLCVGCAKEWLENV